MERIYKDFFNGPKARSLLFQVLYYTVECLALLEAWHVSLDERNSEKCQEGLALVDFSVRFEWT